MAKRRAVPIDVRRVVLHEAGYKCANPRCLYPITLDVHHLEPVAEGGGNTAENLLPLCPTCHTEYHKGLIPAESLRAWKMFLVTLNEAFDKRSISLLVLIAEHNRIEEITGDGVVDYAALAASGLIEIQSAPWRDFAGATRRKYSAIITDKGKLFVESWKKGDQQGVFTVRSGSESAAALDSANADVVNVSDG